MKRTPWMVMLACLAIPLFGGGATCDKVPDVLVDAVRCGLVGDAQVNYTRNDSSTSFGWFGGRDREDERLNVRGTAQQVCQSGLLGHGDDDDDD